MLSHSDGMHNLERIKSRHFGTIPLRFAPFHCSCIPAYTYPIPMGLSHFHPLAMGLSAYEPPWRGHCGPMGLRGFFLGAGADAAKAASHKRGSSLRLYVSIAFE